MLYRMWASEKQPEQKHLGLVVCFHGMNGNEDHMTGFAIEAAKRLKLTGDYVSAQYGKFPITGTLKGSDVSFWFVMNVEGTGLNVTYTGTIDKDGSLKGTVSYGEMMSGAFVASRKK